MKNNISILVILFALILNGSYAQSLERRGINQELDSDGTSYLTVEQSLLPLTDVSYFVSGDFPFNRINPEIKEYLFHYLENDNSVGEVTDLSLRLLGYVADEEDIPFIDNFIQTSIKRAHAGNPDDNYIGILVRKVSMGSGGLIGMMVKRQIQGARELLNKYTDVSVWLSDSTSESIKRKSLSAHQYFLIQAYQYSMDNAVLSVMKKEISKERTNLSSDVELLEKRNTDIYSDSIKPVNIKEEILQQKLNDDLSKRSRGIEPILRKMTFQQWIEEQESQQHQSMSRKPQTNTESVTESIPMTDPNQVGCLESAATQAIKAYLRISEELLAGQFSNLHTKLLNDGKLIDSEKLDRVRDELPEALQQQQAILAEVKKAGLNQLTNFEVKIELDTHLSDFTAEIGTEDTCNVSNGRKLEINGTETAVVTFILSGTAEICTKHIPAIDGVTSTDSDELKVYMKRINGVWYWNPFGW